MKPSKPRRDFPLFAHANGQWAKKVLGRLHYFGVWDDPDAAEALWDQQKSFLLAGKSPPDLNSESGTSLRDLCEDFLESKDLLVNSGELSDRQFDDYRDAANLLVRVLGRDVTVQQLTPQHFRSVKRDLVKKYNAPSSLRREITNCRAIFNWGMRNGHIEKVIRFGDDFRAPSTKAIRRHKQQKKREHGAREFTRDQCHVLLNAANPAMKAMIFLGLNCGFGNTDIRTLRRSDLVGGWVDGYRNKTGVDRVSVLWPDTRYALAEYERPEPKREEDFDLMFITKYGNPYGDGTDGNDPITSIFYKLLKATKLYRPGLSFYTLRHTYRTQADNVPDEAAVNLTMGHVDLKMGANYRQHIDRTRILAVSEHVRNWLFG